MWNYVTETLRWIDHSNVNVRVLPNLWNLYFGLGSYFG